MALGGRGAPGEAAERLRQPRLGTQSEAAPRGRLADPQLPQGEGLAWRHRLTYGHVNIQTC